MNKEGNPWSPRKKNGRIAAVLGAASLAAAGIYHHFAENEPAIVVNKNNDKANSKPPELEKFNDTTAPPEKKEKPIKKMEKGEKIQIIPENKEEIKSENKPSKETPETRFAKMTVEVVKEEFPQYEIVGYEEDGKDYMRLRMKGEKSTDEEDGIFHFVYDKNTNKVTMEKMLGITQEGAPVIKETAMPVDDFLNELRFRSAFMDYGFSHNMEDSKEKEVPQALYDLLSKWGKTEIIEQK